MKGLTEGDINGRVTKRINQTANLETNNNWKFSFEEGVFKSDVNEDALPNEESRAKNHDGFFDIKLIHTQWRYDFTFVTPSGISYTHILYINAICMVSGGNMSKIVAIKAGMDPA